MRVFKYPLLIEGYQTVEMPAGAVVLHVGVERGVPCAWALVDPEREPVTRVFRTVGTGHELNIPEDEREHEHLAHEHLGTYEIGEGAFVGHVFGRRGP